jgi:hypothetical protein
LLGLTAGGQHDGEENEESEPRLCECGGLDAHGESSTGGSGVKAETIRESVRSPQHGWTTARLLLDVYGHFLPTEYTDYADALSQPHNAP